MHIGSLITDDGEPKRRSIEEFKMIARITFTNMRKLLLQKHQSEDQIESNKMLCLVDTILWSRDVDNYKNTVVQPTDPGVGF